MPLGKRQWAEAMDTERLLCRDWFRLQLKTAKPLLHWDPESLYLSCRISVQTVFSVGAASN